MSVEWFVEWTWRSDGLGITTLPGTYLRICLWAIYLIN